jgi:hypothetical protein
MKISLPEFPVEGGCVCGALSYRLSGPPLYVIACHCLTCQCLSGSDYVLAAIVLREDFKLLTGKVETCMRTAESGRITPGFFCPECGTRVWHEPPFARRTLHFRPGTLDDPSWASPIAHMWLSRKKRHVQLPPDVIQYEAQALAGDRDRLVEAWKAATSAGG